MTQHMNYDFTLNLIYTVSLIHVQPTKSKLDKYLLSHRLLEFQHLN